MREPYLKRFSFIIQVMVKSLIIPIVISPSNSTRSSQTKAPWQILTLRNFKKDKFFINNLSGPHSIQVCLLI